MKSTFKGSKILFVIILMSIIITLFITNTIAANLNGIRKDWDPNKHGEAVNNKFTYTNIKVGDTIRFRNNLKSNQIFRDNPELLCVQHGNTIYDHPWYRVKDKVDVSDPILVYILNMQNRADDNIQDNEYLTTQDLKQHMIWWYLNAYQNTSDEAKVILKDMTKNVAVLPHDDTSEDLYNWWITENGKQKPRPGGALYNAIEEAKNYKTKLNSHAISIDSIEIVGENVLVKVKGTFDRWNVYINSGELYKEDLGSNTKEIKIPMTAFTGSEAKVSVTSEMDCKAATFWLICYIDEATEEHSSQRLLLAEPKGNVTKTTAQVSTSIPINTDVSLQKYITHVNDAEITDAQTSLTNRANKKTYEGEDTSKNVKDNIRPNLTADTIYKYNNAVKIEAGDKVTYRIHVYNNSNTVDATEIKVIDRLPYYYLDSNNTKWYDTTNKGLAVSTDPNDIEVKDKNGNIVTYESEVNTKDGGTELIWYTSLKAGDSTYFEVTLKFNKYLNGKIENTAWIDKTTPNNSKKYRTADRDYVEMKKYSVSLEKYITEVTDAFGNNNVQYDNREYHRYNANATTNLSENQDPYKKDNKVQVDAGDLVTYTIKLTNTGEVPVKVTQIYDSFTNDESGYYLEYDSSYGIKGNGNGIITDLAYRMEDTTKSYNQNINRYLIKFDNAAEIQPNTSVYLTIRFKVVVNTNLTQESKILKNKAGIDKLENTIGYDVSDGDGEDNNYDMDYLQTQTYAVSLEKYVSKVKDSEGNIFEYDFREGKAQHRYDNKLNILNPEKYNKPVTVSNGNEVVYKIKLTNNGNSEVKIANVADYLPNGVKYIGVPYTGNIYCTEFEHKASSYDEQGNLVAEFDNGQTNNIVNFTMGIKLLPGESTILEISVEVIEPNVSLNLLKNVAEITEIKNRNDISVVDTTGNDNKDADYIQLDYNPVTIDVSVEKKWEDNNNQANARPISITVKLYRNNSGIQEVILSQNNNWKYVWEDLEKFDQDGNEYAYTIKEVNVPKGYKESYSSSENKTTITNTYKSEIISKTVVKEWSDNDNQDITRPTSIQVQLYRNETLYGKEITLSAENNWTYTWNNLYKFDIDGNQYIYTVKEVYVPEGYVATYSDFSEDRIVITNTFKEVEQEKISKVVIKNWIHNNNPSSQRPTSIQVQLYRDGDAIGKIVTLDESNNWKYVWENLIKYDQDGNELIYTVKEVNVPTGYVATYGVNNVGEIIILNEYEDEPQPETIAKTATKVWSYDSEENRPSSIQVQLYANNNLVDTVELNPSNQWSYRWDNLSKFDNNGNEYIYTVKELNVPEYYKVEYKNTDNGFIIQNKYDAPDSPDVIIGGYVWNDIALDKLQNNYNAKIDKEEKMLEGIKVYLYRVGVDKPVAVKETNSNGYYGFANTDIDKTVITELHKRHIKAEMIEGTQRWSETYYSYYVVFEYDGITYTSTPDGTSYEDIINSSKDYQTDSNAVEKNRKEFNNRFAVIKADGAHSKTGEITPIEYITINENGYIPQSIHVYNPNTMSIQSSTNIIKFEDLLKDLNYDNSEDLEVIEVIEDKLKYVGLGLRGKDTFDLELTSDVDNIKVTINNQQGVYKYSNKVTLRRNDLYSEGDEYYYYNGEEVAREDMANLYSQGSEYKGEEQEQKIRDKDYNVVSSYEPSQGLQNIEVTYKITVQNTSNTMGLATEITNYFDDAYKVKRVYYEAKDLTFTEIDDVNELGYKTVVIGDTGIKLGPTGISNKIDIYVVYELDLNALNGLTKDNPIPTYNMAEITEYRTFGTNTEATRGLLDKDSAPGSVNTEQVRLAEGASNDTTLEYYFKAENLSNLKYEDDTYATPTLYFALTDENSRTIEGIVFRDETAEKTINATTKIKTGNGIYETDKEGEVGVNGATVQLVELVEVPNDEEKLRDGSIVELNDKYYPVRCEETTKIDEETGEIGTFKFTGFLPGNYIIRYYYGNTAKTVLLNQYGEGVNKYSFNGEDYQSTNNAYPIEGMDTNQLSTMPNFWYVYNEVEGISTAKDDVDRRKTVTTNVLNDSDNIMTLLNNIRDRITIAKNDINSITEKTHMFADTESMLFTVEKTELVGEGESQELKQREQFGEYKISNMNFGIAEVPVTEIDLEKVVQGFSIIDSTGQNILAKAERDSNGLMVVKAGNVVPSTDINGNGIDGYLSQIEDEKLQGSRLQITYAIKSNMDTQLNYDNTGIAKATIKQLVDIIDNNLSYNNTLGNNSLYWTISEPLTQSSIDKISSYSTIVKATDSALERLNKGETVTITLEKVLSSTNSTIEEIITSTVDVYEYKNTVEITQLNYENVTPSEGNPENVVPQRDRIRTRDRYIIIPGVQHDTATSETIAITPPTGDSGMSITYYVLAVISLGVLAAGVFGIKKFVVNARR